MRFHIYLQYFLVLPVLFTGLVQCGGPTPDHIIVIDPGHGGTQTGGLDDKWDVVKGKYIATYLPGMKAKTADRIYYEHLVVLELSRRVKYYLDLTRSDDGWNQFHQLLIKFSDQRSFRRLLFETHMSREDSWNHRFNNESVPEVNAPYRMYDFPEYSTGKRHADRMLPGRISRINALRPELVLSIHTNPAGTGHSGGMATVIAPGYKTFDMVRRIHLGQQNKQAFDASPWARTWLVTDPGWSAFEAARADTWVYFHGYRTNRAGTKVNFNKNRGIRYNMVRWAYADEKGWHHDYKPDQTGRFALHYPDFKAEGRFWEREKSELENWRREGGPLGYGGDNHYAGDELLRFVQYGARLLAPDLQSDESIGPIHPPYVSTYSLPQSTKL